VIKDLKIN